MLPLQEPVQLLAFWCCKRTPKRTEGEGEKPDANPSDFVYLIWNSRKWSGDWISSTIMAPARLILLILASIILVFACEGRPLTFPTRNRVQAKCPAGYRPVRNGGCRKILVTEHATSSLARGKYSTTFFRQAHLYYSLSFFSLTVLKYILLCIPYRKCLRKTCFNYCCKLK